MVAELKLRGTEITKIRLKTLPVKIQQNVIRSATNFAMTPVLKQAQREVPVGEGLTPDGQSRPHLRDTLKKKTKLYRKSGTAVTLVGHDFRKSPHALLVHEGTRPHTISAAFLNIGGQIIRGSVQHPGARANRYVVHALTAQKQAVIDRYTLKLSRGIDKEVRKLAAAKATK